MTQADSVHRTPPINTPISQVDATAPAATPEPAIYYKTPVTPEEAFQAIGRLCDRLEVVEDGLIVGLGPRREIRECRVTAIGGDQ
jgi:hypothetical protein